MPRETRPATTDDNLSTYINAGGRGTRLNPLFTPDPRHGVTKALLQVGQPPIPLVDHHVNKQLATEASRIVVGAGDHTHVARHVDERFAREPRVMTATSDAQYGTGGDLVRAVRRQPEAFDEHIMVANVDTILDIDEHDLHRHHLDRAAGLTIALTTQRGVPNQDAYRVASDGQVLHTAEAVSNLVDQAEADALAAYRASSTGALVVSRELLADIDWEEGDGQLSLYRDVIGSLLTKSQVYAYNNEDRLFTDVGTVPTWQAAEAGEAGLQPYLHYGYNEPI